MSTCGINNALSAYLFLIFINVYHSISNDRGSEVHEQMPIISKMFYFIYCNLFNIHYVIKERDVINTYAFSSRLYSVALTSQIALHFFTVLLIIRSKRHRCHVSLERLISILFNVMKMLL